METKSRVIHKTMENHGHPQSEAASYQGINYSTVSKIVVGNTEFKTQDLTLFDTITEVRKGDKFMKKFFYSILVGCFLLFPYSVGAYAINDYGNDKYIGANDHGWGDIIGDWTKFSVLGMDVSFESGNLIVDVYSRYFNDVGELETRLGDLFISTDVWNPYGIAPYVEDGENSTTKKGEDWEFATQLVDYDSKSTTSGNLSLYYTSSGAIGYAYAEPGYTYRNGYQEVRFVPNTGAVPFATGTWAIIDPNTIDSLGRTDTDILRFTINSNFNGISDFGFHWAMTCANDVVEGSYTRVPEPGSLLLLGLGLLGIGILKKKL